MVERVEEHHVAVLDGGGEFQALLDVVGKFLGDVGDHEVDVVQGVILFEVLYLSVLFVLGGLEFLEEESLVVVNPFFYRELGDRYHVVILLVHTLYQVLVFGELLDRPCEVLPTDSRGV